MLFVYIPGNDLSGTEYPSWSESVWSAGIPNVRVFLIPDKTYEVCHVNNLENNYDDDANNSNNNDYYNNNNSVTIYIVIMI